MKIFIRKKYLVVPVGTYATNKKLCFYESAGSEKTLVMDFDCKMDFLNPTYTAYIDVSQFKGRELEYCSIPQMDFLLD